MLLLQLVQYGGPIMWLLIICSVIALIIFFERWFHLHRAQINVGELLHGLINVLKRGNLIEAITLCEETPGPVSHILKAVILRHAQNDLNLKQAAANSALDEIPRMERKMNILATITYVAPMLGILGTVLGLIDAFQIIQIQGFVININGLSGAMWEALLNTAFGLCIAIPCHIAYNYLVTRIQTIVTEMDKASSEIIYFFQTYAIKENNNTSNL